MRASRVNAINNSSGAFAMTLTRLNRVAGVSIVAAIATSTFAQAPPAQPSNDASAAKGAASDTADRDKKFEESMRDVSLVGYFTASDQPKGKLTEERYVIDKVVKDEGDNWMFHARIQYGKHDVPVRLKIPVKWAGDTPVISVTKLAIPLLGTFNARVLLYDGQYAGTWEGAGHGGQLFGRIEKNKKPADEEEEKPKSN
jgi:hypothetical protein